MTTAEPETKTTGNWPFSVFDTGPAYRFTIAPVAADTDAAYTGAAFYALLAANDNGGIWLDHKAINLYDASSGALIAGSGGLTWSAAQSITVTIRLGGGANGSSITISGATTGNGTTLFTYTTHIFTNVTLGVGIYGGGGFTFNGSISDVDDANDSTGTRNLVLLGVG